MSLLAEAVTRLERSDSPHAMIGATAMATLGASRSTQDFDILTTDRTVLRSAFWIHVEESGAVVDIHTGDIQDPLAVEMATVRSMSSSARARGRSEFSRNLVCGVSAMSRSRSSTKSVSYC